MPPAPLPFDLSELYRWIDRARSDSGLTWAAVSTIRRYEEAADAEADGVLALIGWPWSARLAGSGASVERSR